MQVIAREADVSTRTLYNLFGTLDVLLLDAAAQMLDDLLASASVHESERGIPQLLAFASGGIRPFVDAPEYARAVIAILARADLSREDAYARFGPVQRVALDALEYARDHGELVEGANPLTLSWLIASNGWGAVLLWEKGLLDVRELEHKVTMNNCLTLIPMTVGRRQRALERALVHLLRGSELDLPLREAQLKSTG